MFRYAFLDYIPKRMLRRASFDQVLVNHMILGFKDGYNVYTRWVARMFARALAGMDISDCVIVCIPASTPYSNARRWKRFSDLLCRATGAIDGYDRVRVSGCRRRIHVTGDNELASNIKHFVQIDADFFKGRKVIVIDDIYTTGRSSDAFIGSLQAVGAHVVMTLFIARTMRYDRLRK